MSAARRRAGHDRLVGLALDLHPVELVGEAFVQLANEDEPVGLSLRPLSIHPRVERHAVVGDGTAPTARSPIGFGGNTFGRVASGPGPSSRHISPNAGSR